MGAGWRSDKSIQPEQFKVIQRCPRFRYNRQNEFRFKEREVFGFGAGGHQCHR